MGFSQFGQDEFVDTHVFRKMSGGFFVDIGAHDGVTFSNSLLFEKERGWKGICIEPMPHRFRELRANRSCECIEGCVAATGGVAKFTMLTGDSDADMLSGLTEASNKRHDPRVLSELEAKGGRETIIDVHCFQFNQTMEQRGIHHIDYCSIDTEGAEFEILKSINHALFGPTCYSIEENGRFLQLRRYLRHEGYRLVEKLGEDLIFVKREHSRKMDQVGFLRPGALQKRILRAAGRRILRAARLS